jgi:hypothetical protein
MLETSRDFFAKLREENASTEKYIDAVWALRYPNPPPKSSSGWPYTSLQARAGLDTKSNPKVRALRP